ncbi:hypothetical protein FDF89_13000 [Clostridium botulinum]|nr:hypothetical protein [Clostridium botulinum]NFR05339.1 hypothetical protein [Clostridium botulinum]
MKKNYLNKNDKKRIENYCNAKLRNKEKIRVKSLGILLEENIALYEILDYIKNDLKVDSSNIFHGEADYIVKLPRGHYQLTNDLYFDRCYLHQYIVCKELNLGIEEVQKYIVHHEDMDKGNNDINNLWIFFDRAVHLSYHQAIKRGDVDIKEFTMDYIKSTITDKNDTEIKDYLGILDKLQKEKILSSGIDKK